MGKTLINVEKPDLTMKIIAGIGSMKNMMDTYCQ